MKRIRFFVIFSAAIGLILALSLGGSKNPHGDIQLKCETCHVASSWTEIKKDAGFDHQRTQFPLIGAHEQTPCISCHKDLRFSQTSSQCADCHSDVHRGKLGVQCQGCHTSESWENRQSLFQQHAALGFPLTGIHATADCSACHRNALRDDFAGTPTDCNGCHDEDFRATSSPNHVLAGFSTECETCHNLAANSWLGVRYDHPPEFRLEGGHAGLLCSDCHSQQFAGTSNQCFSCHESDFASAEDPNHPQADFDHDCTACHGVIAWSPASFDHALTQFPLTGGHAGVDCASCHAAGYTGTSMQCFSCHDGEFAEADEPDHDANNFDHDCTSCHTTAAWEPSTFDHNATQFALTGAHVSLNCASCHSAGYVNLATDCFSCHGDNFAAVDDPNHVENQFNHDCAQCHSTTAWTPVNFDHSSTGFLLTGAHSGLDCASCHAGGYAGTSPLCNSCHAADYNSTSDPNHALNTFPLDCNQCHSTTAWVPADPRGYNHELTGFALTGAHATVACMSCHASGFTNTSALCFSCHSSEFNGATDPNHVTNSFDHDCTTCHSTIAWEPATFDHNRTDFPLTGAHAGLSCVGCHGNGYTNTSSECFSCHSGDFASAGDPDHQQNNFDHDCTGCHTTSSWSPSAFDHSATQFTLTGAHLTVDCISCHATGYAATPLDCFSCHQSEFNQVTEPNHALQNFDHDCTSCHTTGAWKPATFDHGATEFPLTGAHSSLQCIACHAESYTGLESNCVSCHRGAYDSEPNPDHALAEFSVECQTCHSTTSWMPANWDHTITGFALTGAHTATDCQSCHIIMYEGTLSGCYDCHQSNYASAAEPDHVANNFDHNCATCHTTTAWEPSTFNHNTTGFALTGAHAGLACLECHSSGYANTSAACYSCHAGDFNGVADPNHVSNNFDHNCAACHTTTAWTPAYFDHSGTAFVLTGAHVGLQCAACHATGYANTSAECYSCHAGDFSDATDPNHVTNNFDHNCALCHSTAAWQPASFDHNGTAFPLTGAHANQQCIACHANGYSNTSADCYSCHQGDFAAVTDPNHVANNFDHNCVSCHNTSAWLPATFDHAGTSFPLTGAHTTLQCIACHASGYTNTPSLCFDCHSGDFTSVTDPDHTLAGFSHDCTGCHTTTAWSPTSFNHGTTGFTLTGAHLSLQCLACHATAYAGTSPLCFACHQLAYDNTTNPDHTAANFPTECQTCHTTTAWTPANWNHDSQYFPIYSGKHREKWDQCADCHVNPANFSVFECIFCHEHNQTKMDDKHSGENGYQYNSNACLNCHPNGSS